jgi:pimeloyl-ACP methyl ester carboxylesterase
MTMARAEDWRSRGGYFSWRPAAPDAVPAEIFHVELGDPGAAVLLLIHGWPTSSIDWSAVAGPLSGRFRVCALDFPGYGFSGKPPGWGYSLARDQELVEFYLAEVLGAEAAVIVAHDRGDSVALVHAARCAHGQPATPLEHLVLLRHRRIGEGRGRRRVPAARLASWLKVAGQLVFAKKASSPCPVLPAKVASLRMSVQ